MGVCECDLGLRWSFRFFFFLSAAYHVEDDEQGKGREK